SARYRGSPREQRQRVPRPCEASREVTIALSDARSGTTRRLLSMMVANSPTMENHVAYYTVANASYFLGAVALLNSLRRVGETAPFFVVDCGLTAAQRERLSTRATIVPRHEDLHPLLQKATGPLARPAQIMVFIDADILVTRPLAPLLGDA